MIRRILQREGEFLLAELGAPDARTLFRRIVFAIYFVAFVGAGILGVLAVYETCGLPAMYAVIFILFLLCVRLQRRRPVYFEGDPLVLGGRSPPSLPPPGKRALPPSGRPQIGRSQRPALPDRSRK
jgi:hypothetical protein